MIPTEEDLWKTLKFMDNYTDTGEVNPNFLLNDALNDNTRSLASSQSDPTFPAVSPKKKSLITNYKLFEK